MSHDRFFLDHGAIHDRMTRKHVGMQAEIGWQPRLLSLLNDMWEQITALERSGRTVAAPSPSLGESLRKITDIVDDEVDGYEMRGDDVDYMPTEHERILLSDFAYGLIENKDLIARLVRPHASPTAALGQKAEPTPYENALRWCYDRLEGAPEYLATPTEQATMYREIGNVLRGDESRAGTYKAGEFDSSAKILRRIASPVPASGEGVPHGFALVPTDYLVCAAWWLNHFMRSAPDHGDTVVNSLSVRLSELAAAPKGDTP